MAYVCHTLHYKANVTVNVSFSLLKKVTAICDKYDLAVALKGWSAAWILKWQGVPPMELILPQLLSVASVFGYNEAFHSITLKLLSSSPNNRLSIDEDFRELGNVPGRLFCKLSRPAF